MKIKTLIGLILLLSIFTSLVQSCSPKVGETASSVEEATEILAKQAKAKNKIARKAKKKAYKAYWKSQSKKARKSIKRNHRRQKKLARSKN
jgi:hypothetical protein